MYINVYIKIFGQNNWGKQMQHIYDWGIVNLISLVQKCLSRITINIDLMMFNVPIIENYEFGFKLEFYNIKKTQCYKITLSLL